MQVFRGTESIDRKLRAPVLTIGNFDGLHLGHRAIMDTVIERAGALDGQSVVLTFDPHPRKVVQSAKAPKLLITLEQKQRLLAEQGVDVLVLQPFDRTFASLPPQDFIRNVVHERIRPREVYVGYDFHFGRDREGSMRLLTEMGPRLGFAVTIIPEVTKRGRDVNSTRIRALLAEGDVEEATSLLGRAFSVWGRVVEGDRRGRTIGFPTANLATENEVLPAAGVYTTGFTFLDADGVPEGKVLPSVTNVGLRPTFKDGQGLMAEAHLIDFEGDLYGRRVELAFYDRLRPERKFAGVDALREQIALDVEEARRRLGRT